MIKKNIILFGLILGIVCLMYKEKFLKIFDLVINKINLLLNKTNLLEIKEKNQIELKNKELESDYHSENLNNEDAEKLYKFLQSNITPNINNLVNISNTKIKIDDLNEKILLKFLNQKLNSNISDKKIKDIKLLSRTFYFKNRDFLEILPFQIEGTYFLKNKYMGKVKIQIEMYFKFDKKNSIFMSQTIFNNYMGSFEINRILLTNHEIEKVKVKKVILPTNLEKNNPEKPKKKSSFSFNYDKKLSPNESEKFVLDTINSLIPDDIDITEYEEDSENYQTTQKVII